MLAELRCPREAEGLQERPSEGRARDLGVLTLAAGVLTLAAPRVLAVAVARRMNAPPVRTWNVACLIIALRAFASAMVLQSPSIEF